GVYENVVHASATVQEAEREIKLWFEPGELIYDLYPTKLIETSVRKLAWVSPASEIRVVSTQSPAKEK
ncbi:MAG TPA: hypothetical protein VJC08_05145, partial [bacterium]|nr:hypothetical protein [bacterium]